MAPKKGNKHGVGHGRPPNPGFADADLKKLGEELLIWCKKKEKSRKEVVHLSEFYSELKGIPYSQWESIIHRECFLGYYEKARSWMGKNILKNDRLATCYGNRFLGMYCKDLNLHERQQVEHKIDYELKRKQELELGKNDSSKAKENDVIMEAAKWQAKYLKLEEEFNALKQQTGAIDRGSNPTL